MEFWDYIKIILAVGIGLFLFGLLAKAWGYFTTIGKHQAQNYLKEKKEDEKNENGRGTGKTIASKTGGRSEGK